MTRGQLAAAAIVVGIAVAGLMIWLHIENQREEGERLARIRAAAHQAEVNRQARYKAALDGLKHPWTEQPSVATFISHCRGMLDKIPLSIVGWMTTNVMCMQDQVSVQSLRRTNSAATTAAYVAAVKKLFGVTAEFNFKNSSLTSFTLRQTPPPEGDDPMVPVGERLMNFISLFQALNIDLGVSSVPIKDVKENKEGEKLPLQDWQSYTFSASTDITPELIFPAISTQVYAFPPLPLTSIPPMAPSVTKFQDRFMENVKYTLLLLVAGGVAHAATEIKTVGDIDRLQSGRVLYEAQAAFNKAKNEAGQGDALSLPVGPAQGVTAAQPGMSAATAANTMPSLEKVVGQEATLRLADGSMTSVRAGDSLGGLTVVSVSLRGVVVRRKADNQLLTLN